MATILLSAAVGLLIDTLGRIKTKRYIKGKRYESLMIKDLKCKVESSLMFRHFW